MIELTEKLLTTEAESLAKDLVGAPKKVTDTQVRKFYNDFLQLQKRAHSIGEDKFEKMVLPLVKLGKAKIAYSIGNNSGLPQIFMTRMAPYIDKIQTMKDFDNFILFYQAVIGYMKYATYEKDQQKEANGASYGTSKPTGGSLYGYGGNKVHVLGKGY